MPVIPSLEIPVPQIQTSQGNSTITIPTLGDPPLPKPKVNKYDGHKSFISSYGIVYANKLAAAEIRKPLPSFPVGSMIAREKRLTLDDAASPEVVIAMVKREKGFSKKTGDWEFLVFDGKKLGLRSRQTKGSCAECHTQAKATDWVFREYLKMD
ncbi:MAG: hypothetical protein HKN33_03420 [Pyrinomonadaceae bacterium]|nr:hypothetical protein [Pyrinomonadaceae bacterium]